MSDVQDAPAGPVLGEDGALLASAREEDRAEIARLTGEMDEIRALLRAGRNAPAEFLYPDDEYWAALARKDGAS